MRRKKYYKPLQAFDLLAMYRYVCSAHDQRHIDECALPISTDTLIRPRLERQFPSSGVSLRGTICGGTLKTRKLAECRQTASGSRVAFFHG